MIVDHKERTVTNSKSPIQFTLPKKEGASWPYWYRYLEIAGKKAFETGNICGTCNGFFRRLPGDAEYNISIAQQLSDALNSGLNTLADPILEWVEMLVPDGEYYVFLRTLKPQLCQPGDTSDFFCNELQDKEYGRYAHDQKTYYFCLPSFTYKTAYIYDTSISTYNNEKETHKFLESLVPVIHFDQLDMFRVDYYRNELRSGKIPTVFALGMWDKLHRYFSDQTIDMYDFWVNYIIDGHHKAYAAALENKEISLLTYVRKDNLVDNQTIDPELIQAIVNQK